MENAEIHGIAGKAKGKAGIERKEIDKREACMV